MCAVRYATHTKDPDPTNYKHAELCYLHAINLAEAGHVGDEGAQVNLDGLRGYMKGASPKIPWREEPVTADDAMAVLGDSSDDDNPCKPPSRLLNIMVHH